MQLSRLQLEHYNLTKVVLESRSDTEPTPLGAYPIFDQQTEFECNVKMRPVTSGEGATQRQALDLTLKVSPLEGRNFPYSRIELGVLGVFDDSALPADKREDLVLVNGSSMLYGVLREVLLGLTARCIQGPVMLPTVQFVQLAEQRAARRQGSLQVATESSSSNSDDK